MGIESSKMEFASLKILVVRDALSGEELCQLHNVDTASTGWEVKKSIETKLRKEQDKDFDPHSKRLLWGSAILCDDQILREVNQCSLCNGQPNELSVLTRPSIVREWLLKHERNRQESNYYYRYRLYYRRPWNKAFSDECEDVRSDLECVAAALHDESNDDLLTLQYVSSELQDNDTLLLAAVKKNGLALQYASSRLQDTDFIVSTAVKQNGFALQHASSRLQDANAIVSAAVKQNGLALQHASSRLQDDDLVAWHAVKQNGLALQLATSRLRDDHQIVKDAVMQNGWALEYASSRLQDNWSGIVYFAFRQDIRTQQYASARIQERCRM